MLLALSVIGPQAQALGGAGYKIFDVRGGCIGRIEGNDWVLPDAERLVSSRHAWVRCVRDAFFLEDVSTNGTAINGPQSTIARGQLHPLQDGDRLYIGDYEILVQVLPEAVAPAPVAAAAGGLSDLLQSQPAAAPAVAAPLPMGEVAAPMVPAAPAPVALPTPPAAAAAPAPYPLPSAPAAPQALGVLDLASLVAAAPLGRAQAPAAVQALPPASAAPASAAHAPAPAESLLPPDWELTGFSTPPPAPAAAPAPTAAFVPHAPEPALVPPPAAPAPMPSAGVPLAGAQPLGAPGHAPAGYALPGHGLPGHVPARHALVADRSAPAPAAGGAVEALLAELGLQPQQVPPETLSQLGQILRLATQGLMEVLVARKQVKDHFRMAMTIIRPIENNPLKFTPSVEDALYTLFVKRNPGYLGPLEAYREAFDDLSFHELAVLAGMRAAFFATLASFDPAVIEDAFQKAGGKKGGLLSGSKPAYWEYFRQHYERLTRDLESNFQQVFGEAFVRAYDEQIRKLQDQRSRGTP